MRSFLLNLHQFQFFNSFTRDIWSSKTQSRPYKPTVSVLAITTMSIIFLQGCSPSMRALHLSALLCVFSCYVSTAPSRNVTVHGPDITPSCSSLLRCGPVFPVWNPVCILSSTFVAAYVAGQSVLDDYLLELQNPLIQIANKKIEENFLLKVMGAI